MPSFDSQVNPGITEMTATKTVFRDYSKQNVHLPDSASISSFLLPSCLREATATRQPGQFNNRLTIDVS